MNGEAFGIPISASLCADCDATHELVEQDPGVYVLAIAHDDTCPALRSMEGRRA